MNFLSNENISLIFKVISKTNKISREQIITSMNEFYRNRNIKPSEQLININKEYISHIKKELNNKIIISNDVPYPSVPYTAVPLTDVTLTAVPLTAVPYTAVPYTFEDIQNKKREQFNEELSKKQKEFSSFNQVAVPPPLKFNEDMDKPISEMEELIAKTIAERTLDIENIQKKIEPIREKPKLNLQEKHISWKDDLPLDDFSLKEKMNQIEIKLNLIIDLLNNNKN
jgi:hypothetical protein